jgi:hypothetical protein
MHTHSNHSLIRQTGGTLLGLIIGLLFGLGIAVAVALTINKTTLPFLNKGGKPDRAELTPAQVSDPNKPMYGNKAAAKEAARELANPPVVEPVPPNGADPQVEKNAAAQEADLPSVEEKCQGRRRRQVDLLSAGRGFSRTTRCRKCTRQISTSWFRGKHYRKAERQWNFLPGTYRSVRSARQHEPGS